MRHDGIVLFVVIITVRKMVEMLDLVESIIGIYAPARENVIGCLMGP
jgi:hypothetical protein